MLAKESELEARIRPPKPPWAPEGCPRKGDGRKGKGDGKGDGKGEGGKGKGGGKRGKVME